MNHITSVGLDVHARSIKACAFNPLTGEVARRSFAYSPAEVAEWILALEAPKAVYESGVTGFHLQRELEALGVDLSTKPGEIHNVNPSLARKSQDAR